MKKFLSCVLALALVFSLMSVTVFADNDPDHPYMGEGVTGNVSEGTYNVVGNGATEGSTDTDTITDGVEYGKVPTEAGADITINFNAREDGDGDGSGGGDQGQNSTIVNRYAIDITYAQLVIDLTDISQTVYTEGANGVLEVVSDVTVKYVWNVHSYEYDAEYYDNNGEKIEDATVLDDYVASKDPVVISEAFYITNHSDLSIWYVPTLTGNAKAVAMTMYIDNESDSSGDEFTVGKAIATTSTAAGKATDGTKHTIGAKPTSDWETTITELSAAAAIDGDVIGSITIKITPNQTQQNP